MLSTLRKASGTWMIRLLLLLIALSFLVWGATDYLYNSDLNGQAIVRVGKTKVKADEYNLLYKRQIDMIANATGKQPTQEEIKKMNLHARMLEFVIGGALVDEKVRQLGLHQTQNNIEHIIAKDPSFQNEKGAFERTRFEELLKEAGMKVEDYFKARRNLALRQQIIDPLSEGIKIPDSFMKALSLYEGEIRTIDFVTLPSSFSEASIKNPTQNSIEQWFKQNKEKYRLPERRSLSFIKLEPEDIVHLSSIPDNKIEEEYKKNKERFTIPEKRKIHQLLFSSPKEAELAQNLILEGKTFEDILRANNKSMNDVDLGEVSYSDILDKKIADFAFSMKADSSMKIIQGSFGSALLRVLSSEPEKVTPFEKVKEEIRTQLAFEEASRKLPNLYDSYENIRARGNSMEQAALELGLKITRLDSIDVSGKTSEGQIAYEKDYVKKLVSAAFETQERIENPPLELNFGYLFYEVIAIEPEKERSLNEVKDQVIKDWKQAQYEIELQKKALDIQEKLKNSFDTQYIAQTFGLEKKTEKNLRRGEEKTLARFSKEAIAVIFSIPKNQTRMFYEKDKKSWIIFKVIDAFQSNTPLSGSRLKNAEDFFSDEFSGDLINQIIFQLRNTYPVWVDSIKAEQAISIL